MFSDSIRYSGFYVNHYRESWFFRFIREAEGRLRSAVKASNSEVKRRLFLNSAAKAKVALYYLFGEPPIVEAALLRAMRSQTALKGLLALLAELERLFQQINSETDLLTLQTEVEIYVKTAEKLAVIILKR